MSQVGEPELTYNFPAGKATAITNPLPIKLSTTCKIYTPDASDSMTAV
jgi:hypothetical protein